MVLRQLEQAKEEVPGNGPDDEVDDKVEWIDYKRSR
jgi:hypothetical protein